MKIFSFTLIMPQVDFVTFNNQIFWGILVFFVLYLFITNYILEKIAVLHFVRSALIQSIINWRENFRLNLTIFNYLTDLRYWKSLFFFYNQYQIILLVVYYEYWLLINNNAVSLFLTNLFVCQVNSIKQTFIFNF